MLQVPDTAAAPSKGSTKRARKLKYERSKVDTSRYPTNADCVQGLVVAGVRAEDVAAKIEEGHVRRTCLLMVEVLDLKELPAYLEAIREAQFVYTTCGFVHGPSSRVFLLARTSCFRAKQMVKNNSVP